MPIQIGGSKPPFFGVHDGAGDVFMYYNLARYLAPEQPVYGLQPQGLDGKQAPHTRISDMAAQYVREIRTVQPEGSYFLGGYSFGGKVAFEMAQQFHAQGQKVAMLALFDASGPGWFKPLSFQASVGQHLANLLRLEPKQKLTYLQKRLARRIYFDNRQPLPQTDHKSPLMEVLEQASRDYVPQVYPGRAILFQASEQTVEYLEWEEWWGFDPQLDWGRLVAGGLDIHKIPGHHFNIFNEPYIGVLAEKLQVSLDRIQANLDANRP